MKKTMIPNKIPVYVSVYNNLYSDIMSGIYNEHEVLPSESALSEKYGVSRNTLRQALSVLCEDGLIIRSQGKGTVVGALQHGATYEKIQNPMIRMCKEKVDSIHLQYNFSPPTGIARSVLNLDKSELVLASDVVYQVGNAPVGYSFVQVPFALFQNLGLDLSDETAIEHLVTESLFDQTTSWRHKIKLVFSNETESHFLQIEENTPLLLLETLLYCETTNPHARCKFFFIPEHYRLEF